MPNRIRQTWQGITLCFLSVLVALLLTLALYPQPVPLASPMFFGAIIVSAWYGGLHLGIFATALSATFLAAYVLPYNIWAKDWFSTASGMAAYILVGFAICYTAEALKRGEARYRRVLELSPDAILILIEGKFAYANRAAVRLLGAGTPDDIVDYSPASFLHPDSRKVFDQQLHDALATELALVPAQQKWKRLDGSSVEVEAMAAVLPWQRDVAVQIVLRDLTERLTALDAQARLAAIVQSSDDAIISQGLDGTITSWNAAASKLYGYTAAEAVGQNVSILAPADRTDETPSLLQAILRGEGVEHFETCRKHKSGRPMDVSLSVSPIRDGHGTVVGAAKIARDISDRKQTERERVELLGRERGAREAAERSEERYRALADAMPQCVLVAQPNGEIEYCNGYWTQYTGLTAEQTRRNGWQVAVHPGDLDPDINWRSLLRKQEPFEFECRLRRAADGTYRWYLTRVVPVHDDAGKIVRWIGTGADIHERRCAAEALRASEARLRRLTESNIIGVIFADDQGRISYANEAFLRMTGFSRQELEAGQIRWREMTPPEWLPLDEQGLTECRARGACTPYEKEFFCKHGGRLPVLIGYAFFEDPATEYIGFVLDLASRKALEEELRRQARQLRDADRRKDEFLAMLGHELRNPLAAILTAAQVLRLIPAGSDTSKDTQQIIERQAAHMGRLIDDLLDVARITRGKILLRQNTLDIVDLVKRTIEDHRAGLDASQLKLSVEMPNQPLWVFGDATRLSQVVGNLLHNAQKYTPAGGSVLITVQPADHCRWAEIRVRDTGVGIHSEMLDRIFEPFSQAERNVGARQGGLGLGLALVRGLVELHGGEVVAQSKGINQGAEFTIRIPLRREADNANGTSLPNGQASTRRILVIEDNPDAAKSLELLLKCAGHQVSIAEDGYQGLQTLDRMHPDVVLCDIGLPGGMDGYAVARAIRQRPNGAPFLIALTGFGQEEDHHRAIEAGFNLHLVKPVDVAALDRVLGQMLS